MDGDDRRNKTAGAVRPLNSGALVTFACAKLLNGRDGRGNHRRAGDLGRTYLAHGLQHDISNRCESRRDCSSDNDSDHVPGRRVAHHSGARALGCSPRSHSGGHRTFA